MIQRIPRIADDKEKCDEAFRRLILAVGACRLCGATDYLTTAHFVPRRYSATRTDLRNACCLCLRCHRRLTDNPREHDTFVVSLIGEALYDELKAKSQKVTKMSWPDELVRLKKLS